MHEQYLFNPKSIAVIGATENEEKVGYALMKNLQKFKGRVVPINKKHKKVFDLDACSDVLKYKGKIDLAIIAIPSKFVKSALVSCGRKRIKAVVIISAGFSEVGNTKDEQDLISVAKRYGIRILGPNCFGVANPYLGLDTTFSASRVKRGSIAFISQSGALWSYVSDLVSGRIGFSKFASLGNMSDLDFSDLISFLNKDPKTKSIILYMEKIKQGRRFIQTCKRSKKPIYVIKSGSSKEGSEAAVSHTGSLATDYEIYKGVFRQSGVVLCKSLVQALEKISRRRLIRVNNKKLGLKKEVSIITNAGGAGALVADYVSNSGLKVNSPNDILGTAIAKDYSRALKRLKNKNDAIVVMLTPQTMTNPLEVAEVVVEFKKKSKKQIIACFLGKESIKETNALFKKNNISFFNTLEDLRRAL